MGRVTVGAGKGAMFLSACRTALGVGAVDAYVAINLTFVTPNRFLYILADNDTHI